MISDFRHQPFPDFFDPFVSLREVQDDPCTWPPATVAEWRAAFVRWMNAAGPLGYTPAPAASYFPMAEDEAAVYLNDGVPPVRHTNNPRGSDS